MAKPQSSPGLTGFTTLNPSIYLYRPSPPPPSTTPSTDPDLILLAGWMSATPHHISKYTTPYKTLFPNTPIIFITTTLTNAVFSTSRSINTRIDPLLQYLYTLPPTAKILLHFFSNGGLFTTSLIASTYHQTTGRALNIHVMILDSTPGRATFKRTLRAITASFPQNALLLLLANVILALLFVVYRVWDWTEGKSDFVDEAREVMNDKRVVGTGRRLYLYSKEDDMVDWREVEGHAAEAGERGLGEVRLERFEGSGHVMHGLRDAGRYWGAVEGVWRGD